MELKAKPTHSYICTRKSSHIFRLNIVIYCQLGKLMHNTEHSAREFTVTTSHQSKFQIEDIFILSKDKRKSFWKFYLQISNLMGTSSRYENCISQFLHKSPWFNSYNTPKSFHDQRNSSHKSNTQLQKIRNQPYSSFSLLLCSIVK